MSIEITRDIEVIAEAVEVTGIVSGDTVSASEHLVDVEVPELGGVTGIKKEYSIVGDALYASVTAQETPQWLATLIDGVVDAATATKFNDYDSLVTDVQNAISAIDIASNNYVTQVNYDIGQAGIVGSVVSQLDAAYGLTGIQSTITNLDTVISNELQSLGLTVAQIETAYKGYTDASITTLETSLSNDISSYAASITALQAAYNDSDTGLLATASATESLNIYVGLDGDGNPNNTGLGADVSLLKKQADGIIEFTVDTYDVMIGIEDPNNNTDNDQLDVTKEPYSSWIAADTTSGGESTRSAHVGDVYIMYADDVNGTRTYIRSYKFIKTVIDGTSPYSTDTDGYTWAVVSDTDAQIAYTTALQAKDLADSKRRVFTSEPYGPYENGDLWIRSIGGSEQIWRCTLVEGSGRATGYLVSEWQLTSTDDRAVVLLNTGLTDGTVAIDLSSATVNGTDSIATYVGQQIDLEVVVFSGTDVTTQTGMKTDDIYIEKAVDTSGAVDVDVINTYTYNGTVWVVIGNNNNLTALADLADGKRTIYSNASNSVPAGEVNDIWIPTTGTNDATYIPGEVYQYTTSWVLATKYTENLNDFVDTVNNTIVPALTNQIDAKIDYYFQLSTDPNPDTWPTGDDSVHSGDILYYTDTKKSFYFDGVTGSWAAISDADALQAITDAATAQGTADGKVSHFYGWYSPTDVVPAIVYESDNVTVAVAASSWLYWFKLDGTVYYKPDTTWIPYTAVADGDVLNAFDHTTKDITVYTYNGTSWQKSSVTGIVAGAKWSTDLDAYLVSTGGGTYGGETSITSTIETTSKGEIHAAFQYSAELVSKAGDYYKSGFGLDSTITSGDGSPGNPYTSKFWINANEFVLSDSLGGTDPVFSVDSVSRDVIFNGKVTFNGGQTGTIEEAITASVTQVAVGDKNINITDNLIPTTSLVSDLNNAGYQFIGDPVKSSAVGIETFSEPQIVLDGDDEVYSPYVDELVYAYYFRIGIKGITDLTPVKMVTADAVDAVTYGSLIYQLDAGQSLSATEWYVLDGIINPTGGSNEFSGAIRTASGSKVGDIRNYVIPAGAEKLVLGWQYGVTISRMKLSKITADTITGSVASTDYVDATVAGFDVDYTNMVGKDLLAQQFGYVDYAGLEAAYAGGTTVISGGTLNTGLIAANAITADMVVTSGLITNTAQIANGVITNANIANATIDGAKIANATIGTAQIGSAAIKEAQVDSLAIKTGHLQYQAVTIPVSGDSGTAVSVPSWTQMLSVSLVSTGADVNVSMTALLTAGGAGKVAKVRVLQNGSVIWTSAAAVGSTITGTSGGGEPISIHVTSAMYVAKSVKLQPGVGTVTYVVQGYGSYAGAGGSIGTASEASLLLLEVKR